MTDDQARRDRVAKAITEASVCSYERLADIAIAAYENEPEPTPQLLVDMTDSIRGTVGGLSHGGEAYAAARAALQVIVRKMRRRTSDISLRGHEGQIAFLLGIPESLVEDLLDGE